ncbi:MAG TPA: phosphoglycolate phosphatase [Marinobacterium sp.]|nr:phosphoglycolate phosphatase [Marinobacterium sp.]
MAQLPQLIMLDLDGTLVDSVPDLAIAVDQMLTELDRPKAGEARVRDWVGNGASMLVARALSGSLEPQDCHLEGELYEAAYMGFLKAYAESNGRYAQLYPGVEAALEKWSQQKIPLAVVTNKPMLFTNALLKSLRLSHYFHFVMGGDSLPQKKPDPAPLHHIMTQLGAQPEACWMVGDSKNDVEAGRAAGCKVAAVTYGYNHGENIADSEPDLLVDRIDALDLTLVQSMEPKQD